MEIDTKIVEIAKKIAEEGHKNQFRKFGDDKNKPYFDTHIKRIAESCTTNLRKCLGYLHDYIEDYKFTRGTFQKLLDKGIPIEIVNKLKYLTKNPNEGYFDFIMRIISSNDSDVIAVKIIDIDDNLFTCPDGNLKEKYLFAKHMLESKLAE